MRSGGRSVKRPGGRSGGGFGGRSGGRSGGRGKMGDKAVLETAFKTPGSLVGGDKVVVGRGRRRRGREGGFDFGDPGRCDGSFVGTDGGQGGSRSH